MRLLLDENLSPRLIPRLSSLFAELTHVRDHGLKQASDKVIWDWARANGYIVITTDADFVALSHRLGSPPKVVHFTRCDFPLAVIEGVFRRNAIRISEFGRSETSSVLTIRVSK